MKHHWRKFLKPDLDGGFVICDQCGDIAYLPKREMLKYLKLRKARKKVTLTPADISPCVPHKPYPSIVVDQ